MDQSAPNQFRAALTYLLNQEGRGAQTRLADQQKIDRGYLNAIVRGRKSGSEKKRTKSLPTLRWFTRICSALGGVF